jgi:DNA mismatch endonuclease, patch repair protein
MADIVSVQVRSRMMASIGGKNTRPELAVRSYLHRAGLRFRLHDRQLPGTPDIALPRYRAVVFVHGCFWHRHTGCRFASTPATRADFWAAKFAGNVARDKRKGDALRAAGWQVHTVWECQSRNELALDRLVWRILGG